MLKTGLLVFNTLSTSAVGVWLYLERRNDKTNARVDAAESAIADLDGSVEERLDAHAAKLAGIEATLRQAPTHADLGELHTKVNAVAISQGRIEGELRGISDTLRLILGRIAERGMA